MLTLFAVVAVLFIVICGVVGAIIGSSNKERKAAKQELERAKHKLKTEQIKLINELEQIQYKKQAEQLKELYKDLNRDIAEIEKKIKQIRGED